MYYIHDEEGMEEPIGPFTKDDAKQELAKHGRGWKLIDAETAKELWSHLEDEEQQELNEALRKFRKGKLNENVTPEQKALTTWKARKNGNIIGGYVFQEIKPEDMARGWSKYKSGDVAIYTKQTANDQAKLIGYFKNGEGEMLSPIK
jgi:hypothetical protein